MSEDRDTILINDCTCGCECGNVELNSDHQPEVLILDEYDEMYQNYIHQILEIVQEIRDNYASIDNTAVYNVLYAEKEVQNILTAGEEEPASPKKDDYYINTLDNTLYAYSGTAWEEQEPKENVIYVAGDTTHIWLWNGSIFVDVTGQAVDNIIYTNSLVTPLNPYTSDAMYKVCYTRYEGNFVYVEWYTLSVIHTSWRKVVRPNNDTLQPSVKSTVLYYTQILQNKDGYAVRNGYSEDTWSSWHWYKYAFLEDTTKPCLELAFKCGYAIGSTNDRAGKIWVRDKNNKIQEDDYLILYYWNHKKNRMQAFAGGNTDVKIFPVRWGDIADTTMKEEKGWKDDWRLFPYRISDIMRRITGLTLSQLEDLTWEGGWVNSLLGKISFVGGPKGNGFCTKLWMGVARGVSMQQATKSRGVCYEHFKVEDVMHRIPFYMRCYHRAYMPQGSSQYVKDHVTYLGSHSRKPHLWFKDELESWPPEKE